MFPEEQALQHSATVVALVLLTVCARKEWLSTAAFTCLVGMLWLHILGARYIYSYVPYHEWFTTLCGSSPAEWFGWQRNHYDRLVHFCFGMLSIFPLYEVATRYGRLSPRWAILLSLFAIMTISAAYEIFEWMIAVVMAPDYAEAYNGQQGDVWDPQKDMALALAGSLVAAALMAIRIRRPNRVS